MMKQNAKRLLRLAAVGTALLSPAAFAGGHWSDYDRGSPHAADDNGTLRMVTQQANNTWQDWYWRGKDSGHLSLCPSNSPINCPLVLQQSKTVSTAWALGGGVEAGGGSNNWFQKVIGSLGLNFKIDRTRTNAGTFGSTYGSASRPGQWGEPVLIQVRRWKKGVFMNGWEQDDFQKGYHGALGSGEPDRWHYVWRGNIRYGAWQSNIAQGDPYQYWNIAYKRP